MMDENNALYIPTNGISDIAFAKKYGNVLYILPAISPDTMDFSFVNDRIVDANDIFMDPMAISDKSPNRSIIEACNIQKGS